MDLQSLNSIFERRILRIPDYQRGYAWNRGQLEDFWEDLLQLESERVHYTGVITLEPVAQEIWATWEHDQWLIKDVDYKPFYVVDGQQRLITSTIFIQAIIEKVLQSDLLTFQSLVFQSIEDIRKKFILYKAGDGIRKSYIFGYEKDNPSDEYLRTHIFGMYSHSNQQKKTLYTRNLLDAKKYFKEQLSKLELEEIGVLYKKVTQKFKFNLYEVSEEIDVFVAFEAMNNRGKPLTNLELLKNRLIYLSTLFKDNDGKEELRANINDAWKTMYEYLGKNHEAPLDDDEFLRNHWMMYFKYSRNKGDDYIKFLLNEKFNARNITHPKPDKDGLKIEEIYKYVKSLQQSIGHWFHIHNPCYEPSNELTSPQKLWLDRLNRLSFRSFKPLILSAFISRQDPVMLVKLLEAAERYIFTSFNLSRRRSNTGDSTFFSMSRALLRGGEMIEKVVASIEEWIDAYYEPEYFCRYIEEKYKWSEGFYSWDCVSYLHYEYEQGLIEKGKQTNKKLSWEALETSKKDTLEHIFPQTPSDPYWYDRFGHLSEEKQRYLTHSLGNLLPLSRPKNSSLQNYSFPQKVNNGSGVGYYNGSVSENEVAQSQEWTPIEIRKRGMELLSFMERRWKIELGDLEFKGRLLHLDKDGAKRA